MVVKELIAELQKYPEDMPVAVDGEVFRHREDGQVYSNIDFTVRTWRHGNYPYDLEPFKYLDLE